MSCPYPRSSYVCSTCVKPMKKGNSQVPLCIANKRNGLSCFHWWHQDGCHLTLQSPVYDADIEEEKDDDSDGARPAGRRHMIGPRTPDRIAR